MPNVPELTLPTLAEVQQWSPADTLHQFTHLARGYHLAQQRIDALQQQLDWLQRQVFGRKSERRILDTPPQQLCLGEQFAQPAPEPPTQDTALTVQAHTRQRRAPSTSPFARNDESSLFFDESKVPVQVIEVPNPETQDLTPDQYEIISHKVSYRLAHNPSTYVVLKYLRPVIKRKDTQTLSCPPAPVSVIEGSRADVSLIAGLLTDKLQWHLPLYRQHQRLTEAGIRVSRSWLTDLCSAAISLLEPIYDAQMASIKTSRIKAIDETGIRAGRAGPGKMKTGYFWPIYGQHDEVCFPFFDSRNHVNVELLLGQDKPPDKAVLLSDGYRAYATYAQKLGIEHAQCWAHCRREFVKAQTTEPHHASHALKLIGEVYRVEQSIREQSLRGERKREYRLEHAKGHVETFFKWVEDRLTEQAFLPTNRLTQALGYAHARRHGLSLYLTDPDLALDTNHLERALRPIPLGRKNWLFAWTELGAKHIGIAQSLIITCQLHDIRPLDYLIDVLQRVGQHPMARVEELTPRLWKAHFASQPLRSAISIERN